MTEEETTRRLRLEKVRALGQDPYPSRVTRTHTTAAYLNMYEELERGGVVATLVGRVRTLRKHGGLTFLHLEDGTGHVQLVLKRDVIGTEAYEAFHETVDVGDFLEACGSPFTTQKGERSLAVSACHIIAKALLPLPEKWHGLTDTEVRYRKRYLDLLANESVRQIFRVRAHIVSAIRHSLDEHGFLEVETPILQAVPGGANAQPFVTHHHALDANLYLRIAPELYLKRLLVGGYERVFEFARCFRNEGIDHSHNPEFTQVEGYAAYMDYRELMEFLENLTVESIRAAGLDPAHVPFKQYEMDFTPPWPRLPYRDAILKYAQLDLEDYPDRERLAKAVLKLRVPIGVSDSYGTIVDRLYKQTVRPNLIQPIYLIDYPSDLSPLAKRKIEDSRYVEMFQLVCGGGEEIIKAFSELNDPIDQEERFRQQEEARQHGDKEAQFGDEDYVEAMKRGMPPNAGFGIGIDRLVALLTNSGNLKEVILFPTLRPENAAVASEPVA